MRISRAEYRKIEQGESLPNLLLNVRGVGGSALSTVASYLLYSLASLM